MSASNFIELAANVRCINRLLTSLRDRRTNKVEFAHVADRLMTVICEEGLSYLESGVQMVEVETPTGLKCQGTTVDSTQLVVVSIIRAGDSMLDTFLKISPAASVGKILIQRDEATALPIMYYAKLPSLKGKQVVLLDPMLATGGSAKAAIQSLLDKGADEDKITFFNVISCPQGLASIGESYPKVRVVTGKVDDGLNEKAYIVPGLGDYGDRYYGTI